VVQYFGQDQSNTRFTRGPCFSSICVARILNSKVSTALLSIRGIAEGKVENLRGEGEYGYKLSFQDPLTMSSS
jgi:hypothetical protein